MSARRQKPSAAHGIALIVRRELGAYFRTWMGYIIAASLLFLCGLLYNAEAVGSTARYSTDVLSTFIYILSGFVQAAGILFSMRLIAEERQAGTLPLLTTSSLSEGQIVFAKYLSALAYLTIFLGVTVYMPLLVLLNGSVSVGHILAGYLGALLIGSAAVAIGLFGSTLVRSQLVAAIVSSVILVALLFMWRTARVVEGTLSDVIAYLALHDKHFRPFMDGTIELRNIVFYVSVTIVFLMLSRNVLESRRWRL